MKIEDSSFEPRQGLLSGSVLAPLLFNVFLETVLVNASELRETTTIEKVVLESKLIAFADDLCIDADNLLEAEAIITEFENLEASGLYLNKSKSQIMSDQKEI